MLRQITASMHGVLVLEREIAMARASAALEAGDLAAQPHQAIGVLDRALEREGELGDGIFDEIGRRRLRCCRPAIRRPFCSARPTC